MVIHIRLITLHTAQREDNQQQAGIRHDFPEMIYTGGSPPVSITTERSPEGKRLFPGSTHPPAAMNERNFI